VEVETARRDAALAVPAAALRGEPGAAQNTVWIERGCRVEARAVRLGLRTLEEAEVLDGLQAGDTVLIGSAPPPGQRVQADVDAVAAAATKRSREDAGSALTNAMGR
jgi:HlyD family secretion protein